MLSVRINTGEKREDIRVQLEKQGFVVQRNQISFDLTRTEARVLVKVLQLMEMEEVQHA